MRLAFMGCVQFSYMALSHLCSLNNPSLEIVGVITRKSSPFNADYASLIPLAKENNIPYFIAEGNNQLEMLNWLNRLLPDVIYCFGWSYLLKEPILKLPKLGIVGYHPAALPQNRGRHPIIWALALDLRETASTFFFMDEGADSGDILDQRFVPIFESDDASTLYNKLIENACKQISEFTPKLITGKFIRIPQDHSKANYWRKRNKADGVIDWRMSARNIHNLVRALTRPYNGCQFIYDGKEIPVWKTELMDEISEYANVEPGKILKVEGYEITVRCGEGALKLIEHDCRMPLKNGDYL